MCPPPQKEPVEEKRGHILAAVAEGHYILQITSVDLQNLGLYSRSFHSVFHNPWSRIYCPFCDSLLCQPNQPFYLIIDWWKVCDVEVDGSSLAVEWCAL